MKQVHVAFLTVFFIITVMLNDLSAETFDQRHAIFDSLLKKHVFIIRDGTASQVNYRGFRKEEPLLDNYLKQLSDVRMNDFRKWNKKQQLSFLINAYNAFTIKLILSRYPDIRSIKDMGSLFSSPWKKRFFSLFGEKTSLDIIEHEMIRQPGVYDEPRIHFAVVCASIGCPALRNEAYVAEKLDIQLEDSLVKFLSDRTRNRYNAQARRLEISRIFDWYETDFSNGHGGFASLNDFLAKYADTLADKPEHRKMIREKTTGIYFLDYDWQLNDVK